MHFFFLIKLGKILFEYKGGATKETSRLLQLVAQPDILVQHQHKVDYNINKIKKKTKYSVPSTPKEDAIHTIKLIAPLDKALKTNEHCPKLKQRT